MSENKLSTREVGKLKRWIMNKEKLEGRNSSNKKYNR